MANGYTVIVDTREKHGYKFNKSKYCAGSVVEKLDTGDYSLFGLEDVFCIERKMTVSELAQNVTQKRFENELIRMNEFDHKVILCEFDWKSVEQYPYKSGLPKSTIKRIRTKGAFLKKKILEITLDYGIPVHFAGDAKAAKEYAALYFKAMWRLYGPREDQEEEV